MPRITHLLATAVAVAAVSSACTSSDSGAAPDPSDSAPSATATATGTPAPDVVGPDCADVWRAGETLPADYTECAAGAAQGTQDVIECLDDTRLVVYDDALWGLTGGKVVEPDASPVQDTEEYGKAYSACTGE